MVQVEGLEAGFKSQQSGTIRGISGDLDPFGLSLSMYDFLIVG